MHWGHAPAVSTVDVKGASSGGEDICKEHVVTPLRGEMEDRSAFRIEMVDGARTARMDQFEGFGRAFAGPREVVQKRSAPVVRLEEI